MRQSQLPYTLSPILLFSLNNVFIHSLRILYMYTMYFDNIHRISFMDASKKILLSPVNVACIPIGWSHPPSGHTLKENWLSLPIANRLSGRSEAFWAHLSSIQECEQAWCSTGNHSFCNTMSAMVMSWLEDSIKFSKN